MTLRAVTVTLAVLAAVGVLAVSLLARPKPADPAVLVGAGDIGGCNASSDNRTAELLTGIGGTVFTLGDNAYPDGTPQEFADCYAPTWGKQLKRTRPAAGNHDYQTPDAAGYFGYFGSRAGTPGQGWYSYAAGSWHVIVLNSNCDQIEGGCAATSPQLKWLQSDLAAHADRCVLAYWHVPRFSSGEHGDDAVVQPFWATLAAAGADVVLNGHDHDYERLAPLNASGAPDPNGMREFVVGTGGAKLRSITAVRPNSEFQRDDVHGVLRLVLGDGSYDWSFLAEPNGTVVDAGHGVCH
jgi:hypothetical protein